MVVELACVTQYKQMLVLVFFTNSAAAEIHQVSVSMRNNEHEKRLLLFVLFLFYNKISNCIMNSNRKEGKSLRVLQMILTDVSRF